MSLRDLINKNKTQQVSQLVDDKAVIVEKPLSALERMRSRAKTIEPRVELPASMSRPVIKTSQEHTDAYLGLATAIITPEPPLIYSIDPSDGPQIDTEKLKANFEYLASNIEHREIIGQVVRTIMIQLIAQPELSKNLVNADFNLLMRGFRSAYVSAARRKTEIKEKKKAKTSEIDDLAAMFGQMGVEL